MGFPGKLSLSLAALATLLAASPDVAGARGFRVWSCTLSQHAAGLGAQVVRGSQAHCSIVPAWITPSSAVGENFRGDQVGQDVNTAGAAIADVDFVAGEFERFVVICFTLAIWSCRPFDH
jgi:hypothetical protein